MKFIAIWTNTDLKAEHSYDQKEQVVDLAFFNNDNGYKLIDMQEIMNLSDGGKWVSPYGNHTVTAHNYLQVCKYCGSHHVAREKWVNVNTGEAYDHDTASGLEWCFGSCKGQTSIIDIADYYDPETEVDLFDDRDNLPADVLAVLDKYSEEDATYEVNERMLTELEPLGYTFEYGLDSVPYGLHKIRRGVDA